MPELLFQARQAQSVTYNPTPIVMMRLLSRLENRALAGDDISTTCLRTRRRPSRIPDDRGHTPGASRCATKPLARGIPGRVGAQTRIANSALSVRRNIGDGPRCDQVPRLDVVNLEFPIGIVPSPKIRLASRISARTALRRCSGVLTLFSCLRAPLRRQARVVTLRGRDLLRGGRSSNGATTLDYGLNKQVGTGRHSSVV